MIEESGPLSVAARLSNSELIAQVKRLARHERAATASLVAHLAELDSRDLYLGEGYSSLFKYCTEVLHLSEPAAFVRIRAARLARQFPIVLEKLGSGALNLTTLTLLAPVLTAENHDRVLAAAEHRCKRQVEELVASVRPQPDAPAAIRKLPSAPAVRPSSAAVATTPVMGAVAPIGGDIATPFLSSASSDAASDPNRATTRPEVSAAPDSLSNLATPRAVITPLAPERYKIQFTAGSKTVDTLRRAQDLLRHQIPDGDPAAVIDRALAVLVAELERTRLAVTSRPRPGRPARRGSRHIPAAVRRAAWLRDGGRCAFVSADGHRCDEQGFLQFHHVEPHGVGGEPSLANIELRCRAHNRYEADMYYGPRNKLVRRAAIEKHVSKRRAVEPRTGQSRGAVDRTRTTQGDSLVQEAHAPYDSGMRENWFGSCGRRLAPERVVDGPISTLCIEAAHANRWEHNGSP